MSEITVQHSVRREFVGKSEWDGRFAAVPDERLVDPSFAPLLVTWVRTVAASFGAAYREAIVGEAARATEAETLARRAAREIESHVAGTERIYADAPGGNFFSGVLLTLAYILAVASEAYLNRSVLPWILGVSGAGAFALMCGPAFILPATLERLSHGLLAATSRFGAVLRGVMYVGLALMILAVVSLIGLSRGAVAELRSGKDMTAHQSQIVDATLIWLGVCVCCCAVVAAYSAGQEFRRALHVREVQRQLTLANSALQVAREAESAAAAARASADKRNEQIEQLAHLYEEEFLTERLSEIGGRIAQIRTTTTTAQMLEWAERIEVFNSLGLGSELQGNLPAVPHLNPAHWQAGTALMHTAGREEAA